MFDYVIQRETHKNVVKYIADTLKSKLFLIKLILGLKSAKRQVPA